MSCQQLIQEDPYVFTDTISNTANFMQLNNSQTKYVPLNRQTIYNRQFRQHEPTIASSENGSILGRLQHQKSPSPSRKIIINASSVNHHHFYHKKNGHANGIVSHATKSPRTSPKFFKTQQPQPSSFKVPDGQYLVNNCNKSTTHHSITVSPQPTPSDQQQLQSQNIESQLHHVSSTCENGFNNNIITGIKQGPLSGRVEKSGLLNGKSKKYEKALKARANTMRVKRSKQDRTVTAMRLSPKSRTKSLNVIVEPVSFCFAPDIQSTKNHLDLDLSIFYVPPLSPLLYLENDTVQKISRDEKLYQRKIQLRRRVEQFKGIQRFRTTERSKLRFSETLKLLKRLDRAKDEIFKRPFITCLLEDCSKEAMLGTPHCQDHVLMDGKEQHLIRQCSFLFPHGEQCRVPVHDVMATIAVCNEHQSAPAYQLIDPAKPKKSTQISRKRIVKAPMIRPVKKSSKKQKLVNTKPAIPGHRPTMIIHPNDIQKPAKQPMVQQIKQEIVPENHQFIHQFIHHNSGNLLASSQSPYGSITSASDDIYLKQDLMTICENSYESSEDTGVGGLSENELMSHDVIEPFDVESCAELSKALDSLPTTALDDLLKEPLTSRDDEEYLDRAIEEVSSVGMDQIAITAFDHLDMLDLGEMDMDDEEQRQMISAAANLISMSSMQGFLANHDQDYAAMMS